VLFHLSSDVPDYACAASVCSRTLVLSLSSSENIHFCSTPYENFDESLDLFGDGRIVSSSPSSSPTNVIGTDN